MTKTTALSDVRSIPAKGRARMGCDQSEALIRCTFMDQSYGQDITIETFSEQPHTKKFPFVLLLMLQRIAGFAAGCLVREPTILFLASISRSPGDAVMWCFYLVRRSRELGRAVSIEDLAEDFPLGFPTEDAMGNLWDEQKGAPGSRIDNRLDQPNEWAPEVPQGDSSLPDPIAGCGVFGWPGEERRSDRYGVIGICSAGFEGNGKVPDAGWLSPITALHGRRCKIMVRVLEVRKSGHVGDLVRKIYPSTPAVGDVFDLGTGKLFVERAEGFDHHVFGIKPDDGRRKDWFDPHKLYRLHDQTVEIVIEPVSGEASPQAPQAEEDSSTFLLETRSKQRGDGKGFSQVKFTRL